MPGCVIILPKTVPPKTVSKRLDLSFGIFARRGEKYSCYNYGYSGANRIALPWSGVLPELKNRVEAAIADISPTRFNSCLLNRYNNGNEGMAWHSDEGQGLAKDSAIASLSLGATRKFAFKHKESKEKREMWLEHGQLIVMHGKTQKHWLHTILKSTRIQEPRINLTFRVMAG